MYFDLAIQTCTRRAEMEPDKAEAWKAKAADLREQRRRFGLDEFGRQVEAAPTDMEKRFNFGKVLFDAGSYEEAFKQFQKAKGSPKYSKLANMFMGQCLLKMDRLEMAEMAFQAVEKEITDGDEDLRKDLMYFEALLLERKGDKPGALNRFRELYMEDMDFRDVERRIDDLKKET
jgi:tetratricopeptide (TPR) repeat protein